jgi:phosphatidylinositol 4-kinase
MGFVRRLILALSKKSNLLAHQLIWNIRTNTFKNEDTPDSEMQAKLEPIARQIEIDFTPDARNFYERVFAFSNRLTKVSDTIKVHPKGNARKEGTKEPDYDQKALATHTFIDEHILEEGSWSRVH